jgi:phosphoglycerate dehydrogenase-like enzyme
MACENLHLLYCTSSLLPSYPVIAILSLTPYNAFNTEEALERILTTTAENIKAYLSGHPQNVVTGS